MYEHTNLRFFSEKCCAKQFAQFSWGCVLSPELLYKDRIITGFQVKKKPQTTTKTGKSQIKHKKTLNLRQKDVSIHLQTCASKIFSLEHDFTGGLWAQPEYSSQFFKVISWCVSMAHIEE